MPLAPFILWWVQHAVKLLVDPKPSCVTLTGKLGSGKTERAIQACDYVRERHHFESVLWAECQDVVNAKAVQSRPPPESSEGVPDVLDCSGDSAFDPCRLVRGTFACVGSFCCLATSTVSADLST